MQWKLLPLILIFICSLSIVEAQSYYYVPGHPSFAFLDRLDIKHGSLDLHTSIRNFTRQEAVDFVLGIDSLESKPSIASSYIKLDNPDLVQLPEKDPFLKYFYKHKANFFEVHTEDFNMVINPVINLQFGSESDTDEILFNNTRGFEIRGDIDNKLYFFSSIYENQASFLKFHDRRIDKFKSIPGQGTYKAYTSSISDNLQGYDFLNARAYLGFKLSKNVAIELGHGNHFIGNGYRSLLLSDYSNNYFYFKFLVNVWKFNYQSIIAELAAVSNAFIPGDNILPKKYMATHYLSFKPTKNFEIGLFETVVFSREDQFELQYLNPVILYRTVEQFIGSPDNALLGLNLKLNLFQKLSFYHQTLVDEFLLSEITAGDGWWGNKFGFQFGLKAIDLAGLENLDVQLEYNVVRPYTYAHRDSLESVQNFNVSSFGHYLQPLAHPLGSNFKELVLRLNYQASQKLNLSARYVLAEYGEDVEGTNFGSNIFLPLETRESDYGNFVAQGENVKVNLLALDVSYMLYHNVYIDGRFMLRDQSSENSEFDLDTKYFSIGFRINASNRKIDY